MLVKYELDPVKHPADHIILPVNMNPDLLDMLLICVHRKARYLIAIEIPGLKNYLIYECYLTIGGYSYGLQYQTNSYSHPRQISMYAWDHAKLIMPNSKVRCRKNEKGWIGDGFDLDKLSSYYHTKFHLWIDNNPNIERKPEWQKN